MTPEQRERAGRAVAARMHRRGLTAAALARTSSVSERTIRRLVRGERWPTADVRNSIEEALDWKRGTILRHAGDPAPGLAAFTLSELAEELLRRIESIEGDTGW